MTPEPEPFDYEYTEWVFADRGVFWRMGGSAQREFEQLERDGWRVLFVYNYSIVLRRRCRSKNP